METATFDIGIRNRTEHASIESIKALRRAIYQAFVDPGSAASWLAPDSMQRRVHAFDAREGGERIVQAVEFDFNDPDSRVR
jgi:uncharacterized protein YndB with AHSA1/START domain